MHFLRISYFKKSGAFIFVLLFGFIHAVKALHTHEQALISSGLGDKNATEVKADFSCNICDFQIAEDSDGLISDAQIASAPQYDIPFFHTYILPAFGSAIVTTSGTDPPLFA